MSPEKKRLRILLADDHEILRDGLKELIGRENDMMVMGAVGTGRSAVRLSREVRPDVIVMDIRMPDLNGIDATRQIVAAQPGARVLCLSMYKEQSLVGSMLRAGASGYLVKNCAGHELVTAIRTVAAGQTYISPIVAGDIVKEFIRGRAEPVGSVYSDLSEREREVLQLIAEGRNTKEIGDRLHISDKTVAAHRLKLMEKTECASVADLTRYAIRQGLVEP